MADKQRQKPAHPSGDLARPEMRKHRSKRIRALAILTLALGGTVIGLVTAELLIRIIHFQPKGRAMVPYEYLLSDIPGLLYRLAPNHQYEWVYGKTSLTGRGFTIPVSTNSLGLRDSEPVMPKPPGTFRIVALGDSFTMALGARVEDGYIEVLERMLNDAADKHFTVDVVNCGVGGYNTRQELAFLRSIGVKLDPDLVLLGFQVNDITEQAPLCLDDFGLLRRCDSADLGEHRYDALVYNPARDRTLAEWMLEESQLIRFIAGRKIHGQTNVLRAAAGGRDRKEAAEALLEMRDYLAERQLPFFVGLFPLIEDLTTKDPDAETLAWMQQFCRNQQIPHIALDAAIAGIPVRELWVHPRDHHPNARAHALFAAALRGCLTLEEFGFSIACTAVAPADQRDSPADAAAIRFLPPTPLPRQFQDQALLTKSG